MKYILTVMFFSLLFVNISSVYAAEDRQPKTITGKVRNADLSIAKNVPVSITCASTTITDTTSVNGNYSVVFGNMECQQFDTAFVEVLSNSVSGSTSKTVTFAQTVTMPDIILSTNTTPTISPSINPTTVITPELSPTTPPVASVPEFEMITGIMAGSLSLFTYGGLKLWKSRS